MFRCGGSSSQQRRETPLFCLWKIPEVEEEGETAAFVWREWDAKTRHSKLKTPERDTTGVLEDIFR